MLSILCSLLTAPIGWVSYVNVGHVDRIDYIVKLFSIL
jgi:hypothetical protein